MWVGFSQREKTKSSGWGGCTRQRKERLWEPRQGSELGAFEKLRNENVQVSPSDALAVRISITPLSYPQSDAGTRHVSCVLLTASLLSFSPTCWSNSDDLPISEATTPVIHLRPLLCAEQLPCFLFSIQIPPIPPGHFHGAFKLWLHRSLS